jgi:hypothetical protein
MTSCNNYVGRIVHFVLYSKCVPAVIPLAPGFPQAFLPVRGGRTHSPAGRVGGPNGPETGGFSQPAGARRKSLTEPKRSFTVVSMTAVKPRPRPIYEARCQCGLRVLLHRDRTNRTITCEEARRRHARAGIKRPSFVEALCASLEAQHGA